MGKNIVGDGVALATIAAKPKGKPTKKAKAKPVAKSARKRPGATGKRRIKKAAVKPKPGKPTMSKAAARATERAAEVEVVKKTKARSVGRPLNSQNAQAPWIALGLSRRTFFRRKKAGMLAS